MKTLLGFRPADALTVSFLVFLLVLSLIFQRRIAHFSTLLLIYSALLAVQVALSRHHDLFAKRPVTDIVKNIAFPVVSVFIIFDSLEYIVHSVNPRDLDPWLIRLDYLLFKTYPTIMLESIHAPLLTDILQVAYSSYYFLPVAFGLLLKVRGQDREFDRSLFFILLCFYLSYVGYLLFPALGPRYAMTHLQSIEIEGLFVAEPIQRLLNTLEGIKRDAFPSGHTGIVLVVSYLAFKYHRGFFHITLPLILLLILATVYCRYHYVVDVLGGIGLTVITLFIGDRCYARNEA